MQTPNSENGQKRKQSNLCSLPMDGRSTYMKEKMTKSEHINKVNKAVWRTD